MDVYGGSTPEVFRIDDLLDFSNEEMFSSSKTTVDFDLNHHYQPPPTDNSYYDAFPNSDDFTDKLCLPVSILFKQNVQHFHNNLLYLSYILSIANQTPSILFFFVYDLTLQVGLLSNFYFIKVSNCMLL